MFFFIKAKSIMLIEPKIINPRISTTNSKKNKNTSAPIISPKRLSSFRAYPFPDETQILHIINNVQRGIKSIGIIGGTFNAGKIHAIIKKQTPQIAPRKKKYLKLGASASFFSNNVAGALFAIIINTIVKMKKPKYSVIPGI